MRIVVNTDYSVFADSFRNSVDQTADDFAGLVQRWRDERPSFKQVLNHELNSFGGSKRGAWQMQIAKLASELMPDDSLAWLDAAMHPVMREYSSLRRAFERRGLTEEEASDEVFRFWDWRGNLNQPSHQIGSFLFAAISRKIVAGQKKLPTRGFMNDVRAIAAYAPYVDAMFIDRECAALLNEEPLKSLPHLNAKIFSINDAEEFLAYLAEIEAHAPIEVTQIAKSLYHLN